MTQQRVLRAAILAMVGCTLALSACDAQSSPPDSSPSTTSSFSPRDINTWKPSFTPAPRPVSAEFAKQSRLDQVNQALSTANPPLPAMTESELPPVIREVSSEEWTDVMVTCLTEAGFPAKNEGGLLTTEAPEEQRSAEAKAEANCVAQYPIAAKYTQKWGEEQWRIQYEYLTGFYIPCVESFGVVVDHSAIPSEKSYVENALSEGALWHPIFEWPENQKNQNLVSTETEEGESLSRTCRQFSPDRYLFN
ncbi:hypothetical protein SAMN05421878_10474 [Actinobaculum suis]|uniref:Lipoprotein n=1 Tax=Actinobaculum suis TaxID=1657 RepID=A0A1G7B919_9ACTO|nr:hypothetical protein [Actinobaculum suis]MDY5153615.1 hypothetical protein [Actinobaculum suis]SDE23614.1 hypothetical protein SAMN05421878_10474 [Actinobaculum suis]